MDRGVEQGLFLRDTEEPENVVEKLQVYIVIVQIIQKAKRKMIIIPD